MNEPYIGFEGPIGAGKTTLATLLSIHVGAKLILEDLDGMNFSRISTETNNGGRCPCNCHSLASRHAQVSAIPSFVFSL